jgi:hypothetical protein
VITTPHVVVKSTFEKTLCTIGPFIRAKISRGLNKSRTTRINSQFATNRGLCRPSFQLWAYFCRGVLQIDCLYESFATYISRGLFRPSFQLWTYFSRGLLQIDCLYELFGTYLSRGLFGPRLIFARINGPNDLILVVHGYSRLYFILILDSKV